MREVKNKEVATHDFLLMISESWTWERLTPKERARFTEEVTAGIPKRAIKGSYDQRWSTLQGLYSIYLDALGYTPIGWREKEVNK